MAVVTAVMTLVLILAGGFVTTTKTGDTIPEWPRSWGRMEAGWPVEWTHRAVAGVVGLLVLALAILLQRTDPRPLVRRLGWIALAAVLVQALLGGLRIYTLHRAAVAIVHACFAQLVFCIMVGVAVLASRNEARGPAEGRTIGFAATVMAFLQLVAGAVTRHTGAGFEVHVAGAVGVMLLSSLFASRLTMTPLHWGGRLLMGLLAVQILLGFATWMITRDAGFERSVQAPALSLAVVSAHVALGASILAASLVLTLKCARRTAEEALPALEAARS